MNQVLKKNPSAASIRIASVDHEFVTVQILDQLFGLPVKGVQDILAPQRISPVPLAPKEVSGLLNLRGRIVTAIDVRTRLGLPKRDDNVKAMSVVVEHGGEFYSLMFDKVGEVMNLSDSDFEKNPVTLDDRWREVSGGIYRLKDRLLVILDVNRLLQFGG